MHLSFSLTTNEPTVFTDQLESQQDASDKPKLKQIMNLIYTILRKVQSFQKNVLSTTTTSAETVVTESMNSLSYYDKTDYQQMRKCFFITGLLLCAVIFLIFLNGIKQHKIMGIFTAISRRNDPVSGHSLPSSSEPNPEKQTRSPHPMFHVRAQKT